MTYKAIASFVNTSATHARTVCQVALETSTGTDKEKLHRKKLEPLHLEYLTSKETLKRWAGYSLDERASLFTNSFPDKELSGGKLWHLYNLKGIKFKKVARKKMVPPHRAFLIPEQTTKAYRELKQARAEGLKVVWCDEVMFTKHTNKDRDWSARGCNTLVAEQSFYTDYRAVVASVSVEKGVETIFLQTHGINTKDFTAFLALLRQKNGKTPLALYMDNLGVHTNKNSREKME
jgi:hypothetical protein